MKCMYLEIINKDKTWIKQSYGYCNKFGCECLDMNVCQDKMNLRGKYNET